jgi:hypothetical protein
VSPLPFGPWVVGIAPAERIAQLRALAALAAVFLGSAHPLVEMLRAAERDDDAAAQALALLDRVPSLTGRRMLATFCRVTWPPAWSRRASEAGAFLREGGAT